MTKTAAGVLRGPQEHQGGVPDPDKQVGKGPSEQWPTADVNGLRRLSCGYQGSLNDPGRCPAQDQVTNCNYRPWDKKSSCISNNGLFF